MKRQDLVPLDLGQLANEASRGPAICRVDAGVHARGVVGVHGAVLTPQCQTAHIGVNTKKAL